MIDLNRLDYSEHADTAAKKDEGPTPKGLHLKYINTQQLIRQAQMLYSLAKEEDDDHSGFAAFLIDLDRLVGKHGAKQDHDEDGGDPEVESTGEEASDDDEDWK
jgi:hypothetical protein